MKRSVFTTRFPTGHARVALRPPIGSHAVCWEPSVPSTQRATDGKPGKTRLSPVACGRKWVQIPVFRQVSAPPSPLKGVRCETGGGGEGSDQRDFTLGWTTALRDSVREVYPASEIYTSTLYFCEICIILWFMARHSAVAMVGTGSCLLRDSVREVYPASEI